MATIAFIGSSLVSAYWNGAATYYRGLLGAMAARGHQITFYEPDAYDRQANRDIPDPDWARVVVWQPTTAGLAGMLAEALGHELVVKASGVGVLDRELEAAVASAGAAGRLTAFWDVDAPATLERTLADPADPFRAQVGRFDYVFTYGGGDAVVDAYHRLGARRCVPIYNALDPVTHHGVEAEPELAADLTFLGNRLPDREARVDAFFLTAARLLPHRRFLLGGSGWDDKDVPANVVKLGHVPTGRHNALNCSATAILNLNRDSMARYGFSPPTRVFEAAGAGACIITDDWAGIDSFLAPDREILVVRDGAELAARLDGLDSGRAGAIGRRAQAAVLARHTYAQRAQLVDAALAGRGVRAAA